MVCQQIPTQATSLPVSCCCSCLEAGGRSKPPYSSRPLSWGRLTDSCASTCRSRGPVWQHDSGYNVLVRNKLYNIVVHSINLTIVPSKERRKTQSFVKQCGKQSTYKFKKVTWWCIRAFVRGTVRSCVIQFALGSFYSVHISVLRKEEHACSTNTIRYDSVKNNDFIHVYFS